MTRLTLAREAAATRPLVRPPIQILQRRCAACGTGTSARASCPQCIGEETNEVDREGSGISQSVEEVLRAAGQPLDKATRQFMERRLGHDFSRVRVHSDRNAAEAARSVNAAAFTVGNDIVLGAGAMDGSLRKDILAHELVHVVQQAGAARPPISELTMSSPNDPAEAEADRISRELVGNRPARSRERTTIRLSRQLEGGAPAAAPPSVPAVSRAGQSEAAPQSDGGETGGLTLATCPCCIDSVTIGNISQIDNATHMGHSFDATFSLDYATSGPDGNCKLEWWEKTNVPAIPGHQPNVWTDMYALYPQSPTFDPWKNRTKSCGTCSGVTITDPPALGKRAGRTVNRKLEFRIRVVSDPPSSSSGCGNAHQEATATQVLNMVNGAADWANSSFTTP